MEIQGLAPNPLAKLFGVAIASSILLTTGDALAQVYSFGSSGTAVRDIQNALGVSADGVYGLETENAVFAFQSRNGLQVDGQVGPSTLRALGLVYLIEGNTTNVGGPSIPAGPAYGTSAIVRTVSGDVLNVRDRPNGNVVGVVNNGVRLNLTGRQESAAGFRWAELSGGGWVASEYLVFSNTGGPDPSYPNYPGDPGYPTYPGGTISQIGPYVVAVPGSGSDLLFRVRRFSNGAFQDQASQGAFVNAGAFQERNAAENFASLLRRNGFDARVTYRTYL
ncbi:peptidoglycan-binding domain-containing protein [Leptolyngbya sp. AN02str]|uniref:peptidoglycan-binding domain-containing protein n=1 Tax=Leptolyngbya sp. AN02str TaxID=3423363 RepID=UPI003D30F495